MNSNNKRIFFLSLFLVAIVFLGVVLLFLNHSNNTSINSTPIPVPSSFNNDYSNLNLLVPGKSTLQDVLNKNGAPFSKTVDGNKIHLYYKTPGTAYENVVFLKDNIVVYALENVFGNYRGNLSSFQKNNGKEEAMFYQTGQNSSGFPWYMYFKKGIAVQSTSNQITAILYFIPQDKSSFMENVGNDLNFVENQPGQQGEPLIQ